jgi:RHS repeat-associated protein
VDPNSGFYYLRARWMDPGPGRFTSVDPFEGCISCPQSLHPYGYAFQSPINNSDPSGEVTLSALMEGNVVQSILRQSSRVVISQTIRGKGKKVITHLVCAGAQIAAKDAEIHHILSDKNKKYTARGLSALGGKKKKYLQNWFNLLKLPGHRGRHTNKYHEAVTSALEVAVTGKGEAEALQAAVDLLVEIAADLCDKKGKFWKALSNVP